VKAVSSPLLVAVQIGVVELVAVLQRSMIQGCLASTRIRT